MGKQEQGGGMRAFGFGFCVLLIASACAVQATEDAMAEESAGQMATHQEGEQDTVVKQNMEAKAAEMLAEEESNESEMQEAQEHPDLGESAGSDEDPPAPWVEEDKIKAQKAETRQDEKRIEAVMARASRKPVAETPVQEMAPEPEQADEDDSHGDLGESDDVGVQSTATEANAMTAKVNRPSSATKAG